MAFSVVKLAVEATVEFLASSATAQVNTQPGDPRFALKPRLDRCPTKVETEQSYVQRERNQSTVLLAFLAMNLGSIPLSRVLLIVRRLPQE